MGAIYRQKPNHRVAAIIETVTLQFLSLLVLCVLSAGLLALVTIGHVEPPSGSFPASKRSLLAQTQRAGKEAILKMKDFALDAGDPRLQAASHRLSMDQDEEIEDRRQTNALRLGKVVPEVVSWSPRIFHLHNFLSEEECDGLRKMAEPHLQTSTVVNAQTGQGFVSKVRTSSGMFLQPMQSKSDLVKAIEDRIAAFSLVPPSNGETIQILRYEIGQQYLPHPDYFQDQVNIKRGGQRVATMLMYIATPEEGGETIFPDVGGDHQCMCGGEMKKGLCVRPEKGDAVLFWSVDFEGKTDQMSVHGSCPVVRGEKWSATKWMRQHTFM